MPKLIVPPVILLNRIDRKGFIDEIELAQELTSLQQENKLFFYSMINSHPYSLFEDTFDYETHFYITSVDEYRFIKMQMEAA